MKNTKFIIVSGMSGAGKSTTSQNLAKQLELNKIPNYWLHEEIKNHPIRSGEFNIGSTKSTTDMDKNVEYMYGKWRNLVDEIINSDKIYIMEGCLYQNIIRYFFDCNYPLKKITMFYDEVMNILSPLNPTLVYLYRSDVRASFKEAFRIRGDRWKNIILDPEGEGYFEEHPYDGEESIYKMWEHYQEISSSMYERFDGYKIKFDTLKGEWDNYLNALTKYIEIDCKKIKKTKVDNLEQYLGQYSVMVDGNKLTIKIKIKEDVLYCETFFWKNMKLYPIGNDEFEMQSFPINLKFNLERAQKSVTFTGIYGSILMGKTLKEELSY